MFKKKLSDFDRRLAVHYDELKWLYAELYHNDEQAFAYFLTMLRRMHEERPAALKDRDHRREYHTKRPAFIDMPGISLYADRFGRNLQGVRKRLDYLQSLGVKVVHLMPLFESPEEHSDGGYAVSDYSVIQPRLGTLQDLSDLTADCHARGMAVCLDFVMNHTSNEHVWAQKACDGDEACQDRYFIYDNWEIPQRFEEHLPQAFPQTAPGNFTWCKEMNKVVMTTFFPYQWDLNYANPTVFNDMTANLLFLCNQGADMIRLDSVPYIWKEMGTACRNLPQVHTLIRMMRMAVEIVCPGTILLGEVTMGLKEALPYFGTQDKPECDMLYDVTTMATIWHTVATKDVRLLAHQLKQMFALPKEEVFVNYLRSQNDIGWCLDYAFLRELGMEENAHRRFLNEYFTGERPDSDARGELYNDDPRLGDARLCGTTASLCGIQTAAVLKDVKIAARAIRLDIMLHSLLYTLSGMPMLCSGDEIGRFNDDAYRSDPLRRGDSRNLHRGVFEWSKAANARKKGTLQQRLYDSIRNLAKLRSAHRVFRKEADVWILETGNGHVLGIGRYYNGEKLLALFNFGDAAETVWIEEKEAYRDLLTGKDVDINPISVASNDFVWLITTL